MAQSTVRFQLLLLLIKLQWNSVNLTLLGHENFMTMVGWSEERGCCKVRKCLDFQFVEDTKKWLQLRGGHKTGSQVVSFDF